MRRSSPFLVAFQLLLGSFGTLSCSPGTAGKGPAALPQSDHSLTGAPAPAFELAAINHTGKVNPAAHAGKVILLDFWATWCEPCRESFPEYEALRQRFGDQLVVLGVSEDDESEPLSGFSKEVGVTFPLAWDESKSVAASYRIRGMPTLFVIDRSGLIRYVHNGYRPGDEEDIAAWVQELL